MNPIPACAIHPSDRSNARYQSNHAEVRLQREAEILVLRQEIDDLKTAAHTESALLASVKWRLSRQRRTQSLLCSLLALETLLLVWLAWWVAIR